MIAATVMADPPSRPRTITDGTGGAAIEGQAISVDGHVTPVRYRWYESDIRQAKLTTTWSDAGRAIDRFAFQLGRGEVYARR